MNDDSFSTKLRLLSRDYYQNHIGFTEYRDARKKLLDLIDEEFNGHKIEQTEEAEDDSLLMKTVAFFANTDLNDKDKS